MMGGVTVTGGVRVTVNPISNNVRHLLTKNNVLSNNAQISGKILGYVREGTELQVLPAS